MKNRIVFVYDNSSIPTYDVANVIGEKSFGQVVYKRKTFSERIFHTINSSEQVWNTFEIDQIYNLDKLINSVDKLSSRSTIIHMFADFLIRDEAGFILLLQKMQFADSNIALTDNNRIAAIAFVNKEDYMEFLKHGIGCKQLKDVVKDFDLPKLDTNVFFYVNDLDNFLQFMTSGFDARYFNSLQGDDYTVVKTSNNKQKIKAEYTILFRTI